MQTVTYTYRLAEAMVYYTTKKLQLALSDYSLENLYVSITGLVTWYV